MGDVEHGEALQTASVKHVSMGVTLYMRVMGDLKIAATQLADGDTARSSEGLAFREAATLIKSIGWDGLLVGRGPSLRQRILSSGSWNV